LCYPEQESLERRRSTQTRGNSTGMKQMRVPVVFYILRFIAIRVSYKVMTLMLIL
jgi:hypothetical protein